MAKTKKPFVGFRIDPEVKRAMEAYKRETGVPLEWQANRAITEWLRAHGALVESPGEPAPIKWRRL